MWKRVAVSLAGFLYAVLLVILFALQANAISGELTRFAVNGLTFLLSIPAFLLFWLWMKLQDAGDVMDFLEGRNCAEDDVSAENRAPAEMQREPFFAEMEQAGLSGREQEVAWLICRGYSNRQIAEELYISETTVKKHASHIYEKLRISGRKELKELQG